MTETFDVEYFKRLAALGIDPIYIFFVPKGFVHPKIHDPTGYVAPSLAGLLMGCAIFTTVVSTVALAFRLVSRGWIMRQFGWADAIIIISWCGIMGTSGLSYWGLAKAGLGYHIYDCNSKQINYLFKYQYIISLLNPTTITLTRTAILIFLWELAPVTEGKFRKTILGIHFFNVSYLIFTCFPIIFQCAPHTFKMWDLMSMLGCHVNRNQFLIGKLSIASAVYGTVLDFVILVLPIRLVWRLRVPVTTRIAVSSVFAVGFLACIAAVVRAGYVGRQFSDMYNVDLSWNLSPTASTCLLEQCFGMITACAPSLKAAYNSMSQRTVYKSENENVNSSGSYVRSPRRAHVHIPIAGGIVSRRGSAVGGHGNLVSGVKNMPRELRSIDVDGEDDEEGRSESTQNLNRGSMMTLQMVMAYGGTSRRGSRSAVAGVMGGRRSSAVSANGGGYGYQMGGGPDDLDVQLMDLSGYASMSVEEVEKEQRGIGARVLRTEGKGGGEDEKDDIGGSGVADAGGDRSPSHMLFGENYSMSKS